MRPRISVIVPVLNEERRLDRTLERVVGRSHVECIVVDGGSDDASVRIARNAGACVLHSPPGRAVQMNAGAARALGDTLLFLHADTLLPADFEDRVIAVASEPGFTAGAFRLGIEGRGWSLRIVETVANWRARFLQLPYGDQALFVKEEVFRSLGGFPLLPIMEDFELVRRLHGSGRIRLLSERVVTSGRRWIRTGVWKTTLINQWAVLSYLFGRDPNRIASWYRAHSKGGVSPPVGGLTSGGKLRKSGSSSP